MYFSLYYYSPYKLFDIGFLRDINLKGLEGIFLQLLTALKASSNSEEKYSVVPIWVFRNLLTPPNCGSFSEKQTENYCATVSGIIHIFLHIFPVFRKYMVQKFPVIAKVKRFFYFMQVVEEISDNKPAPDSPFLCIFISDLYCCRRTIDTDYVKSLTCQVYSKLPAPQPRSMVLQGHTFHFEPAQQANPGVSRYSMEFYQAVLSGKAQKTHSY